MRHHERCFRRRSTLREQGAKFSGTAETNAASDFAFVQTLGQKLASLLRSNFVIEDVRRPSERRAELPREVKLGQVQIERYFIRTHALPTLGSSTDAIARNDHALGRRSRNVRSRNPRRNTRQRLRNGRFAGSKGRHAQSRRGMMSLGGCGHHRQRKCITHGNLSLSRGCYRAVRGAVTALGCLCNPWADANARSIARVSEHLRSRVTTLRKSNLNHATGAKKRSNPAVSRRSSRLTKRQRIDAQSQQNVV